jgi:hypothetical protein
MPIESPTTCSKNPRRVAAGKRNWLKRGPWTEEARERVRQAILKHQPWLRSTGPRTREGKARSAANGKVRQKGPRSVREVRAHLAQLSGLIASMEEVRSVL